MRDAVLGGLLWSANTKESAELALTAGLIIDAIDVLSMAVCFVEGSAEGLPAGTVAGGAAIFVGLGWWGLRAVRTKVGRD